MMCVELTKLQTITVSGGGSGGWGAGQGHRSAEAGDDTMVLGH